MLKKWVGLVFTAAFVLAACHAPVYNQTEGNVADVKIKAAEARSKSDASAKTEPSLLVKPGPYVDMTPVSLQRKPAWLKSKIVIRGDQLPFSYYSRTIADGAGVTILTKYQEGLEPSVRATLSYTGTVEGALNLLATKTGYVYTISNNSIYWQAFVTKTFDIAFMPGGTDYLMGNSGGSSASASSASSGSSSVQSFSVNDSSTDEYSSLSGKLSLWTDLETTIKQLLSPVGKVTVSQSTTSVTVRDTPTNVELVRQFVANLNSKLSKQVLVKVQVLEVDLQNAYDFGINWNLIANAFHNSPFVVNGNYGTPVSITALTTQSVATQPVPIFGTQGNGLTPSYTILFNALNQQGKTAVVTEPRVVCLNNQVSVIRITETEGYVASIQNTSTGAGGTSTAAQNTVTSQVTPGSVTTGLTLYILPKILGKEIYMQVNADLSTNKGFSSFGPTSAQVQLPSISVKHFNQRSKIRSGDTLILSGFRQVSNIANANQFLESQALGGKASIQRNKETIVLITPFVLAGSA